MQMVSERSGGMVAVGVTATVGVTGSGVIAELPWHPAMNAAGRRRSQKSFVKGFIFFILIFPPIRLDARL
jgi:F0F1-type ATP synthase membrane subunit c/vacuolar-type H+-ATPase subunit K